MKILGSRNHVVGKNRDWILKAVISLQKKENKHDFKNNVVLEDLVCKVSELGLVTLEPGLVNEGLSARPYSA